MCADSERSAMAQWNDVKSSFCLQSLAHAMAMYDMYVFDCLWLSFHQLSFSHHSCITDFNWQIQGTDDLNHFTCMLHQMVRSSVRSPARLILYSSCNLVFLPKIHLHHLLSWSFLSWSCLGRTGPRHCGEGPQQPRQAAGAAQLGENFTSETNERSKTNESGTKICRLLCWFVLICWCVLICVALDQFSLKMIPRSIPWKLQSYRTYRPIPGLSLVAN